MHPCDEPVTALEIPTRPVVERGLMTEISELTVVLIRHAIAEDRDDFARTGKSDDLRPLTDKGRKRMQKAARGLRRVVPELDRLFSSPLVRARQTAEIVSEAFGGPEVESLEAAATGDGNELLGVLRAAEPGTTIAVVGHEPINGNWTGWLLTGAAAEFIAYKKGEACALSFAGAVRPGAAVLLWKIRPRQLRQLA